MENSRFFFTLYILLLSTRHLCVLLILALLIIGSGMATFTDSLQDSKLLSEEEIMNYLFKMLELNPTPR